MENFTITVTANSEEFEITIGEPCYTDTDIREEIREQLGEDSELEFFNDDDFEYEITDFQGLPMFLQEQSLSLFAEIIEDRDLIDFDLDIIEAGINCDIPVKDIAEAYSGQYDSDADFAEETADQLGYMNDSKSWPFTCIDWEQAAKELMYDYCKDNGYYFRNF